MPTPRQHGGAALAMIPLTLPGFKGLNTAQKTGILGPEWATTLQNAVIDNNNRVAARAGWDSLTTSAEAEDFVQLHSYYTTSGTEHVIAASASSIFSSTDGGASWTDITGALTPSAGNWQFVNFQDAVYGIQQGHDLIKATSGNFAAVSATNVPSGNAVLAAFGRLWALDSNGTDMRYSALLNGDDWDSSDAGVFDLSSVWPGTDTGVAIAAFNGALVVFGQRNIIVYTDGAGSPLGINPVNMYVVDLLTGVGCVARDSVQAIVSDLWFLSEPGVQSFGRVVIQKSNPLNNLSRNVHDEITRRVVAAGDSLNTTRSVYSPRDNLYLLSIPADSSTGGVVAFDTRTTLEDGSARCVGTWDLAPVAMASLLDFSVVMSIASVTGEIGAYRGAVDDGAAYDFVYQSGWMDLTQQGYLLLPKRYSGTFYTDSSVSVAFKWAFDFSEEFRSASRNFVASGSRPQFGVSQFGIDQFGGGISLRSGKVPGAGTGQFIRLGISVAISGQLFSIQQLNLFCKVGRYA